MRLRNLTGHEIVLVRSAGDPLVLAPDEDSAVLATETVTRRCIHGIPIVSVRRGVAEGLPAPEPDVIFVTSQVVARHAAGAGRTDVVAPDTSPESAIRENGKIVAVRRLATFEA